MLLRQITEHTTIQVVLAVGAETRIHKLVELTIDAATMQEDSQIPIAALRPPNIPSPSPRFANSGAAIVSQIALPKTTSNEHYQVQPPHNHQILFSALAALFPPLAVTFFRSTLPCPGVLKNKLGPCPSCSV